MSKNRFRNGSTILEVLIALPLLTMSIAAALLLSYSTQSLKIDSITSTEALAKAARMFEEARAASRQNFHSVISIATTTDAIYQKNLQVADMDLFTKKLTSTVTWTGERDRPEKIQLTTIVSDWHNSGSTCSNILSGDWKNPEIASFEFGKDLIRDASSGFPLSDLDIHNGRLYATIGSTNGTNTNTLFIFDVSNPKSPTYLTSVDNNASVITGLNAVRVAGTYAYVANGLGSNFTNCAAGSCGQLQIIDISTTPPQLKTTFKVPGVTGKSGQAIGQRIFYKNGYIYLGLAKTASGPEFNIIDAHDPLNPVYKGGYSVGNGINAIFVRGAYAYIATPNSEDMTMLDISDPSNPFRVGGYDAPGGSHGKSLYVADDTAYLGRIFGTNEFYILDTSKPSGISVLGSRDIGSGTGTSINGLIVRDTLAFFITNTQFHTLNVSDPAAISPWTNPLDLPSGAGGSATALGCEGNYFYAASLPAGSDKGRLSIITSAP